MTTSQPDLKALFLAALERPQGPERAAYLADACGGEASLRAQVEELLEAHVRAGVFLASATETAAKGDPDLAGGEAAEWLGPETARENLTPPGTIAEGPGSRIGPYTIIRKLGEGGMGIVFLAEQERPVRRKVALKVIKPGMDTEQVVARFEAERQALALMEHPGIARVLDAGATDSGRPFFVMELIDGVPINEYCDQERLSPRQRLELFVAVCRAIEHAAPAGDHPPRHQAIQRAGDADRRPARAQGDRFRRGQGDRPETDRADAVHAASAPWWGRRST